MNNIYMGRTSTATCSGTRSHQEDLCSVSLHRASGKEFTVSIVLDGHGNNHTASYVKALMAALREAIVVHVGPVLASLPDMNTVDARGRARAAFLDAFNDANETVTTDMSGATGVVCVRNDEFLVVGHVGDCYCLVLRGSEGSAQQAVVRETAPLHIAENIAEQRRIQKDFPHVQFLGSYAWVGDYDYMRIQVTRAFGDRQFGFISAHPSVGVIPLVRGQAYTVLLCSDGLTDAFPDDRDVDYTTKSGVDTTALTAALRTAMLESPASPAARLIEAAKARPTWLGDNTTAVISEFVGGGVWLAPRRQKVKHVLNQGSAI
jgi:serine/threonine protein phosphatase PrpC